MNLIVHTASGAPRGWRVLLGLAFKGLPWQSSLLDVSAKEHRQPTFLSINARGTVPVLEAGSIVIRDSIAILAWLDREFPDKPLFGHSPEQAAQIWQTTMECCDYLRDAGNELLSRVFPGGNTLPPEQSTALTELASAAEKMQSEFSFLERLLQERPFLAGEQPSAADAVAFPEIQLIWRALETRNDVMSALGFTDQESRFPKVGAWRKRVLNYPGVDITMPPHWRESN